MVTLAMMVIFLGMTATIGPRDHGKTCNKCNLMPNKLPKKVEILNIGGKIFKKGKKRRKTV